MTTKPRKAPDKAVAEAPTIVEAPEETEQLPEEAVAPDAAPDQDVAPEEVPPPTPTASTLPTLCADCGSPAVIVTTGVGAARRNYCAKDAPVNARR